MSRIKDTGVSFIFALSVFIHIGSLMLSHSWEREREREWLFASACPVIETMHVRANIEVYMCHSMHIFQVWHVSACVCTYQVLSVHLHVLRATFHGLYQELGACLQCEAARVSSFSFLCQKQSVCSLHVPRELNVCCLHVPQELSICLLSSLHATSKVPPEKLKGLLDAYNLRATFWC